MTLTCYLPREDCRRFSKATPKLIKEAVERIWDPEMGVTPRSNRIIQDIQRVKENLKLVVEADGAVVPGVVDRNGHRNSQRIGRKYWPRRENPKALSIEELGLHSDCREVVEQLHDTEWNIFQQNTNNIHQSDEESEGEEF